MKLAKIFIFLFQASSVLFLVLIPLFIAYVHFFVLYSGEDIQSRTSAFFPEKDCTQAGLSTDTFNTDKVLHSTEVSKFEYFIKTPENYSHKKSWPLLVVFSPSVSGFWMERYTGLTKAVTQAGFVIAYVDAVPMNLENIIALESLPKAISEQVCIDLENVFFTGHSDGGSISQALHFLPDLKNRFNGFISSAAGVSYEDLSQYACPDARHVFVLHNTGDQHFKNLGSQNAAWWANCFSCEGKETSFSGCVDYEGCDKGSSVRYCEQNGGHLTWPRRHTEIAEFLRSSLQ